MYQGGNMKVFQAKLVFVILLIIFLTNSLFSQVKDMTTKELVEESTAIVVGKCLEKKSYWNDKQDKIFTEIRVQASQYIKGDLGSETTILVPGGRVDNIIYEVSDMPVFEEGEEALVFLWKHPSGKNLVTGALHGKLRIVEDKTSGQKVLRGEHLHVAGERHADQDIKAESVRKSMLLDDFVKEVKALVNLNVKEGSHE